MRNSAEFIMKLKSMEINKADILVIFKIESLFTRDSLNDTLQLLEVSFRKEIVTPFRHHLMSTYFAYNGKVYEQAHGHYRALRIIINWNQVR